MHYRLLNIYMAIFLYMIQLKQTILKIEVQLTLSNLTCTGGVIVRIDRVLDYTVQNTENGQRRMKINIGWITQ